MFRIYDLLGGKAQTIDAIERRLNWRPSKHAIKKWHNNRAMSPRVALALVEECRERGIAVDPIKDFRAAKAAASPDEAAAA